GSTGASECDSLSLHDALPICADGRCCERAARAVRALACSDGATRARGCTGGRCAKARNGGPANPRAAGGHGRSSAWITRIARPDSPVYLTRVRSFGPPLIPPKIKRRMGFWKKLFSSNDVQEVDYYAEGLELMSVGKYHDALTSFRLALRESPQDPSILQQVAMAYTRIGMTDQAAKTYRQVLEQKPHSAGAHYGLAFLLLRDG